MKKQLFSFVMMLALVIVAGTAMAQGTSTTPFLGAKYTYTVNGINAAGNTRTARIYFTTDAAPGTLITPGTATSITISGVTNSVSDGAVAGDYHVITLNSGATSVAFDATFGATVATSAHRIWIQIFDDATTTTCSNMMYLNVTPTANTLDYTVAAANLTQCPSTTVPTSEKTDAVNNTTAITYTITRNGGTSGYNWSFDLSLTEALNALSETTAVTTAGTVTNVGSVYTISGSDVATVTVTVTNLPGTADDSYTVDIASMKQYVGTSTNVNSTSDLAPGNNSAVTTLKRISSISGFEGN